MPQASYKTELADRDLWYDGDTVVPASRVEEMVKRGIPTGQLFVDELTEELEEFNKLVPENQRVMVKAHLKEYSFSWNIPEPYVSMTEVQIQEFLLGIAPEARHDRIRMEVDRFAMHGLLDVLRTLMYVINTLEAKGIPWGVGRGSSVASYILYLIGVHDVDSVEYDLDFDEFLPPL